MMYEDFAAVYDALMADVDYDIWADYYLRLLDRYGLSPRRAADCACGTGNLTIALSKRGLQMTGLDLSMEMLRLAGEKARKQGMQIPFIRQDMRRLLLHRPMEAIFCACDGVNYLTKPQDVMAFFQSAHDALLPGGGLFFDISSSYKLSQVLGNRCLGEDGENISYFWQNHYDPSSRILQMDLTFFRRETDGRYARFFETHFQRAHEVQELLSYLDNAGFRAEAFGDRALAPPAQGEMRIHFAAIRA